VATVFPQIIGRAATFDDRLLRQDADAIGTEFRAKYNATRGKDGSSVWYKGLTVWSPNMNIFRDPRWGQAAEFRITSEKTLSDEQTVSSLARPVLSARGGLHV
jgi:beta-glucosidase-like glycosyl hydrolase